MSNESETRTICPTCGRPVDSEGDIVRAVELVDLPGFGQVHDYIEGQPGLFHRNHVPHGWRVKDDD